MDTTTIVLLLIGVVVISVVIVVFSQMRERAKIERMRRVTALEDAYNRARRLYEELPAPYLNKDIKLLLLHRMEEICQQLAQEKSALPVNDWLGKVTGEKQKVVEGTDEHPDIRIDTPDKANYVKELLQGLFKLVEFLHKSGKLPANSARNHLRYVLFLIHKTHADLQVFQAREHIRQNELRKAIHAYHLAASEMAKSSENALAQKAVQSFKQRIRELETELTSGESSRSAEQQNRLDKDWDSFLHDDAWKKKADYDD
ncbi:hypothetical protein [uncultured Marinobacter sp.]|uniref:hypothetical protein n=1 Tax=uncultured Marinobacter sp. TaxID=187379 RepID=UPI0030DA0685